VSEPGAARFILGARTIYTVMPFPRDAKGYSNVCLKVPP